MPLYEFVNEECGIRTEQVFPVNERPNQIVLNGTVLTRRTVPSRVTVGVGARPPTHSDKLAAGYKHLEERGGLSDKAGKYLDVKTIKRALAEPDTD